MRHSSTARKEAYNPAPAPISINSQGASPRNATIENDGSVTFNASQAYWLYFLPTGVFGDAQGLLKLVQGNNGPFDPGEPNVTVRYCITDPNTTCNPDLPGGGGNTIKVGG
jgi:hypothetical protein